MDILMQIASGAIAVLIALIAIYLSLRLLGKIAKLVISIILLCLILWFVFFGLGIFHTAPELYCMLPSWHVFL